MTEHDNVPLTQTTLANARLIATAPKMLAKLQKLAAWLDRLADAADKLAKDNRDRFPAYAESCEADAKNYRTTAADIRAVIAEATGDE